MTSAVMKTFFLVFIDVFSGNATFAQGCRGGGGGDGPP